MFKILYLIYLAYFLHLNTVETSAQGLQTLEDFVVDFTQCIVADYVCPDPNIRFFLYNREIVATEGSYEILSENMDSINSAPFINTNALTRVIFHGYTKNKDLSPNMELRPALLDYEDMNIISVDWSPLAKSPCYIQAVINTDVVGKCTAQFLASLFSVRPDVVSCNNIHLIGFSLGAHCAGDTGKYLQELDCEPTWITGLEPALPLFVETDITLKWRLDSTDAEFVDIYHTDVGQRGQFGPDGHVDVYINTGTDQPGCMGNSSCNHVRSVEIYAESISTNTGFYGVPCTVDITSFLIGSSQQICTMTSSDESEYLLVGFHIPHDARGTYQVITRDNPPYANGLNFTSSA